MQAGCHRFDPGQLHQSDFFALVHHRRVIDTFPSPEGVIDKSERIDRFFSRNFEN